MGYRNQNFDGGAFSFMQIELIMDRLRGEGKRVLIVLPRTYLNDSVPNHTKFAGVARVQAGVGAGGVLGRGPQGARGGGAGGAKGKRYTTVTQADKALVQKWKDNDELYFCLRGSNDDWYDMTGI